MSNLGQGVLNGTLRLGRSITGGRDAEALTEILKLVVFFWTLALLIKGVDAVGAPIGREHLGDILAVAWLRAAARAVCIPG